MSELTLFVCSQEHPNIVSGGIWAFHFGYDNKAFPSMERAAQLILNSGQSLCEATSIVTGWSSWRHCSVCSCCRFIVGGMQKLKINL